MSGSIFMIPAEEIFIGLGIKIGKKQLLYSFQVCFPENDDINILGEILSRNGEADLAFYSSRIKNEYDIENLPGHKDIWKILSVTNISKNKNGDSEVTINYLEFSNLTKDFKKREKPKQLSLRENGISIMNLWIS